MRGLVNLPVQLDGLPDHVDVGGIRIDLPPVPDLLPDLPLDSVASASRFIEDLAAGGSVDLNRLLRSGVAGAAAEAAKFLGAAGGAVPIIGGALAGIGSLIGSLFGGGPPPPPPPQIAGFDEDAFLINPLINPDWASVAGLATDPRSKLAGSSINRSRIVSATSSLVGSVLDDLRAGKSPSEVNSKLVNGTYGLKSSWRAVAYFVGYAQYDVIFADDFVGFHERKPQLGKLLAWAAPRIQVRELFARWSAYLQCLAVDRCTNGNPNLEIKKTLSNPGCSRDVFVADSRGIVTQFKTVGYNGPIRRCRSSKDGGPFGSWSAQVARLVSPWPFEQRGRDGKFVWVYHSFDAGILAREVEEYYARPSKEPVKFQYLYAGEKKVVPVTFPRSASENDPWSFPFSYAEAAAQAIRFVRNDVAYSGELRSRLQAMHEDLTAETKARVAAKVGARAVRVAKETANRKKAAKPGLPKTAIAIGAAVAAFLALR